MISDPIFQCPHCGEWVMIKKRNATMNDICQNCGCPRWRHHMIRAGKDNFLRYSRCNKCGSAKCKQFRRNEKA